eukprot:GHUV01004192.1.p1 GENE.GHUV01004192.1~~GHUV01004192.1.p1  ORF type:complete len:414 (+),score=134.93 GHUV01004192.1:81-1322(+)
MIGQKTGSLAHVQCSQCRQLVYNVVPKIAQHTCGRVPRPAHIATSKPGRSQCRQRFLQPCKAVDRDIGGYTPSDYITWSDDPKQQCHHQAEVVVDAPVDACFALWMDWTKIIDFLDLIGQIGLDDGIPDMALLQCFYRWRRLPLMEITFLLERTKVEPNKRIKFQTCYGMPMKGQVTFQEQADGQTKFKLYFTHGVPNLLVQLQVGPFGVETDLMRILKENLAEYKTLVEQTVPEDWQQQKQQVADRVQQQQQQLSQQVEQQPQQEAVAAEPAEQQQGAEVVEQPDQQLEQAAAAAVPPPAAAGRKQRSSRRTTQEASAAAAVAEGDGLGTSASTAADAAAERKPRGRPPTSRRGTTSKAAAAAAELFDSTSSSGTGRRGKPPAASKAEGQQGASGRPARRSSRRTTASVQEQ